MEHCKLVIISVFSFLSLFDGASLVPLAYSISNQIFLARNVGQRKCFLGNSGEKAKSRERGDAAHCSSYCKSREVFRRWSS